MLSPMTDELPDTLPEPPADERVKPLDEAGSALMADSEFVLPELPPGAQRISDDGS